MSDLVEIRVRGKDTLVPFVEILGRKTIVTGKSLKLARIMDEELVPGDVVSDSESFIERLRSSSLKADVFTVAERPPQITPRFSYAAETDNWAVVRLTNFDDWWKGALPQETRKNVRRAAKKGIEVKKIEFSDDLVRSIKEIYDESPIRQGRRFWHYQKDFSYVRKMNATYNERAEFYGAFYEDSLVGFIKLIFTDDIGSLIQILAMGAHTDKRPMNALIAEAVKACLRRGCSYLTYGNFDYGTKANSSLAEFKRRNGFVKVEFPRYFVPLTRTGRVALGLGYRTSARDLVPRSVSERYVNIRAMLLSRLR